MPFDKDCAEACHRVGAPLPSRVVNCLSQIGAPEIRVLARFVPRGRSSRSIRRKDLEGVIEEHVRACSEKGHPTFSSKKVKDLYAVLEKRKFDHVIRLLGLSPVEVPSFAPSTPVHKKAVRKHFAPPRRRVSPFMLRLGTAAAVLPFYHILESGTRTFRYPAMANNSFVDKADKVRLTLNEHPSQRLLLCFCPSEEKPEGHLSKDVHLTWPTNDMIVSFCGFPVSRRGTSVLPVDVTHLVNDNAMISGSIEDPRSDYMVATNLIMLLIVCVHDAVSSSGDPEAIINQLDLMKPEMTSKPARNSFEASLRSFFEPVSLMCPLTGGRLTTPARGALCSHSQCFDLGTYLKDNSQAEVPLWRCPVCNFNILPHQARIDHTLLGVLTSDTVNPMDCYVLMSSNHQSWKSVAAEEHARRIDEVPSSESSLSDDDILKIIGGDFEAEAAAAAVVVVTDEECAAFWGPEHGPAVVAAPETFCTECHGALITSGGDTGFYEPRGVCMICQI